MCCISSEPTEDSTGRLKTKHTGHKFQRSMLWAPYANCTSFAWFCGQFIPITCGITQCMLRRKILDGDMTKYSCFQGYFNFCGFHAGACGEQNCPTCCAFLEGCICNCIAVSANRAYVMEKFDLSSDPCDYRLIRINNCLQLLACVCNILAIFIDQLRDLARLIDRIADLYYHCVSGCMTAQTAYEVDYQKSMGADLSASPGTHQALTGPSRSHRSHSTGGDEGNGPPVAYAAPVKDEPSAPAVHY